MPALEILESKEISTRARHSIPSLDGLRAFSIALVILAHARQTRGFPTRIPLSVFNHGGLGVHIFFVISGFLITTLLIQERAETGGVSLKLFYARRTLRIFPAYYCLLAVIAAGAGMGWFSAPARNLLLAATYTTNYPSSGGEWITGHTWSLSVEEQFYLVWPLTIKLAGSRRAYWIAGLIAVISPLVCCELYLTNHRAAINYFPVVAAPIAGGCLLAGAMSWLRSRERILRWFRAPAGDVVLPLMILLDLLRFQHPKLNMLFGEPALTVGICYAIVRYTQFPDGCVASLLNAPAVAFAGRLSYSLYLWQQVFMFPSGTSVLQTFPLNVGAALCCALLSYYVIERPTDKLRKRLHPAASSATAL
jgi:peptidoglycan/LPS O-acetylase OafA/YrhL